MEVWDILGQLNRLNIENKKMRYLHRQRISNKKFTYVHYLKKL